ncbi:MULTISPECIES: DUF3103 family protein [unclassified Streptomyces]|uniref:DUF3103 family protein n=1 Tax=unclassified Streptomyces TaxID=2593676 RepID=UPI0022B7186A|nr:MULTISPECIES: DUF3103 family protein [unclassified Streptomyces]MCZ7414377.1 DUF3103 family protein [Streptomyces sp. WMMC897]MCZ7431332.1 DUF3103 family protein [Streptomyces sp. WMMC1477]
MNRRMVRRNAVALTLCTAVVALAGATTPAAGATAPPATSTASYESVTRIEEQTAKAVAMSLGDAQWREELRLAVLESSEIGLHSLTTSAKSAAGGELARTVAAADRRIAAAKGLDGRVSSLLRLRLGTETMRQELSPGTQPLVAVATQDDDAMTVTAYDSRGRAHTLDAAEAPRQAVYVIDLDMSQAVSAGLDLLAEELTDHGLHPAASDRKAPTDLAAAGGFWTTKVDSVYLKDDEEPWISGDAEIFSLVSGFGLDGKVRVDPVDMPYLDTDERTYYPNQVLVNWSFYKYNLADVVMMEDDGDTNYRALATAIADALLTIIDQGAYIPLVNAVLDAIPDSWYTNDPDYVDSWYTLAVDTDGHRNGARGNGRMNLSPYWVDEL